MSATELIVLVLVGAATGATTVLFGFGGGFVAVPAVLWADHRLGAAAPQVAAATSALVMVVGAAGATAATDRAVLRGLRGAGWLLALLAAGGVAGALAAEAAPAGLIRWGFIGYVAATLLDLLMRGGFVRHGGPSERGRPAQIRAGLGLPIGAVAAFLGVGGSVLTVPLLRRGGHPMQTAAALANPLTLAIAVPAAVCYLTQHQAALVGAGAGSARGGLLFGAVDLAAAMALLAGSLPVITVLRHRPPRLPDALHARAYLALLGITVLTSLLEAVTA